MKWYSIEKYEIPVNCDLLVYCPDHCWNQTMVARYLYESGRGDFYSMHWDEEGKLEKHLLTSDVSHFCIIEPVEINQC